MDLSKYIDQLREGLASATAAADEQTQRTAMLLGAAIEPTARLTLMNALSDLAAEVTATLGDRVVDVRLDGRDVRVGVSDEQAGGSDRARPGSEQAAGETEDEGGPDWSSWAGRGFGRGFGGGGFGGFGPDGGDISRVTLRLVEQMKNQAERAAAEQGMSLNSWVAQAVQGALSGHGPGRRDQQGKPGRRDRGSERNVKGWVQG